jgi:hypothetical protein
MVTRPDDGGGIGQYMHHLLIFRFTSQGEGSEDVA